MSVSLIILLHLFSEPETMHHTLANAVSCADTVETDLTPVQDPVMAVFNAHWFPTKDFELWQMWAGSTGLNRVRFLSPSIRQVTSPFVRPINGALFPSTNTPVADYRSNPFKIRQSEEFQVLGTQTTGGAVFINTVMHWMQRYIPMPPGQMYTMRGTAAQTLVAHAWTQGVITWADILPAGRYAIVGLEYIGATAQAARLILADQIERPGCFGTPTALSNSLAYNTKGALGVFGYFDNQRMPILEFLGNAADTAEEIYMDIIRVA